MLEKKYKVLLSRDTKSLLGIAIFDDSNQRSSNEFKDRAKRKKPSYTSSIKKKLRYDNSSSNATDYYQSNEVSSQSGDLFNIQSSNSPCFYSSSSDSYPIVHSTTNTESWDLEKEKRNDDFIDSKQIGDSDWLEGEI